jgi:NodT family efflux transporter outer membrane factor (OMF) lipoprotein
MISIGIMLLFLLGCASTKGIVPQSTLLQTEQILAQINQKPYPVLAWWQHYQQATLNSLVKQAIEHNPSLKIAQARVRQSEAVVQLAGAAQGPAIDFNANVTHRHLSAYGQVPPPLAGTQSSLYDTGINFRYVFDIWGQTRAQIVAALSEKAAVQIEAEEARRVLSLAVSSHYFQYQALQTDIVLLDRLLQARQAIMTVLKAQYLAGILQKDQLDWLNTQLHNDQQALVEVKTQAQKTQHALARLLGKTSLFIKKVDLPTPQLADLQGLNINMIGQRADVRAARWRVESHAHNVKAAKAAFYPALSLSAFVGFNALHLADWFRHNAHQTFINPALNLPIFHSGELRATLKSKTAQYDEAVESYNQILLNAVQDAADKYADLQSAEQSLMHQTTIFHSACAAVKISTARYKAGILSKQNDLNNTIQYLQTERQFNAAKHHRLQSELAMIQALAVDTLPTETQ